MTRVTYEYCCSESCAAAQVNVVHCLESLGSWQNEFVIEVEDAAQASQLAAQVQERFESQIDTIHVIPTFRYHKAVAFTFPPKTVAIES